jgi:Protein of unknown function (DUF1499)
MSIPYLPLIAAAVAIAILIFLPTVRAVVFWTIRIVVALAATVIAILGVALLLNNETVWDQPGAEARIIHFLTVNQAATSDKGLGSARCRWPDEPPPTATPTPAASAPTPAAPKRAEAKPVPGATPAASPSAAPSPDVYPELMTRSYPGIPRAKLFELSKGVVESLGGWKIDKADPRSGTLDCIYTTRTFGWQDDIRITITPKSEVELCARSGTARPNSTSMLRFIPGDFGSNMGHIKQFYDTLEPQMDAVYRKEQELENAKKPAMMR